MWHEARKQEKKIRGMMVDYKRRAERRREYYEKIRQDPAQFLQVHGRPAKIHLDPAVAIAADSPATMMPWQGHADNLIDRFDVRAHLDIIPEYNASKNDDPVLEDRQESYERYRTLVQNDFLSVNEDKFLHQIFIEERFGIFKPEEEKKKPTDKKAAIGYVYEDSTESPPCSNNIQKDCDEDEENEEEKEEDLSDIDLDVTVDVNMLTPEQCAEMNAQSVKYGMVDDDFITYLLQDKDEAEQLKLAREIEEEKAMYSGRKSRRERRALREKKLAGRKITSPPSYAARDSPTYAPIHRHSASKSRSRSPPEAGKIMFITSFGGEGSDGDQLGKSGAKALSTSTKHAKSSKSKESSASVIGPQLPSKNGDEERNPRVSRNSSYSDSSRSSYRSKQKQENSSKQYSHRRSRHSSRSSSGRSVSPKKSSVRDKKRLRRSHSRSSSRSYSASKSRSRSRSRHHSRRTKTISRSKSRSRSKSTSKNNVDKTESPQLPPPPVKSYYRHSLSRSNSDLSEETDEDKSPVQSPQLSNMSGSSRLLPLTGKASPATKPKLTPQERLKRKMQLALKKQYRADKQAQMEKTEKQLQERQDRAEELREMAIKLRQRERERRHKMRGYDYDSDSDTTWTKNPDYNPSVSESAHSSKRNEPSSSRSNSSYSSQDNSPPPAMPSNSSGRTRSKSPSRVSRRSPVEERRRSPYRRRSSPRHSPKRSPQRNYRRSPVHASRNRSRSPPRRYSPSKESPRRRSPPRSPARRPSPPRGDSRRYAPSRQYRQGNYSPRRSRSPPPPRSYGTRPLVDY